MTRPVMTLFALVAVLAAWDCPTSVVCTDNIVPAIVVNIADSVTGEPRAAEAAGIVQSGTYVDSLRPYGFDGQPSVMISRQAADERPGTYSVRISAPGYQDWQRSSVHVGRDECHVKTVTLVARLQPVPQ